MENLKRNFKPYYKENHIQLMKIEHFITFEIALMIVKRVKADADAHKGYCLLTKYHLIGRRKFTFEEYLVQNACIALKRFRSEKIWNDTLKDYMSEDFAKIRLYDIEGNGYIKLKDISNLSYGSRCEDYLEYLINYSLNENEFNYARKGRYGYFNRNAEEKNVKVAIDNDPVISKGIERKSKVRGQITISINDLIEAADEMKRISPNDYCERILKSNFIKVVKDTMVEDANKITINEVTNIVGMVAAGKSTFLKVVTFLLEKKGYRTVVVTDTVSEVFNLYKYFNELGCNCSPLIGKGEREKYINQLIKEDEYYLDENLSAYLTTNCIIDGYDENAQDAIPYGEEPCAKLNKGGKKYVCPYFDLCPTTAMQREALESNIVITTTAGFVMGRVGKTQNIFMETAIQDFDVVFFDECDRVQKNLDELFSPSIAFNDFINESAENCRDFMLLPNSKRMENADSRYYVELLSKSPTVLMCVVNAVRSLKKTKSKSLIEGTFSAYILLEEIREKNIIKDSTYKQIYNLIDPSNSNELSSIIELSCISVKDKRFDNDFDKWINKNEPELILTPIEEVETKAQRAEQEKKIEYRNIIKLILVAIYFDHFIMEVGYAYEDAEDTVMGINELVSFVRSRFSVQQDYIPSALMGNLFGMKTAKEDDIMLYRQYAYGRTLMTELPYLRINENGLPMGPHTILLSGSSCAEGALDYHVNVDVNYIIEAPKEARDFLKRTKFIELGIEERISGSSLDKKEEILKKVIDKSIHTILKELQNSDGKILIVVNSYKQANSAYMHLQQKLKEYGCDVSVCAMIQDKNIEASKNNDGYIRRGEIYRFSKHKARILIAPAIAIERGYNIVDESGHAVLSSVFFMIRPLPVPDDVSERVMKMNGYIAKQCAKRKSVNLFQDCIDIRRKAAGFWSDLNWYAKIPLSHIKNKAIKTDIVASMFILILQIFGRLCRITDYSKTPPTVYFVDGAFRRNQESGDEFDTLDEFRNYLDKLMSNSTTGEISKSLYEPFYEAFKGGIKYNGNK